MRFLPLALFLLAALPNLLHAQESCGKTCRCGYDTAETLKAREKIRSALASIYYVANHGQKIDMNEYNALCAEAVVYGIVDVGRLPMMPKN